MTFKRKKVFFVMIASIAVLAIIFSMIAPLLAPNDPLATDFANILQEPSEQYPFGTDQVGRCIYSRILHGARVSLGTTILLLGIIFVLGLTLGIVSGLAGGFVDTAIMRMADTVLAFPDIVFAIAIVGVLGQGMKYTIIALSIIWWTKYARLTRTLVLDIKDREYIHAAVMGGASKLKVIRVYILPNIISPLIVKFALDIGGMMLSLAGLSFLGLGVQPPTPEWGNMLNEGRDYLQTASWLLIYPGLAIFIVVSIFNMLGDAIRDILDPKHV
ncbi:ABC transporter permease subunit [Vallitalea pronyensis]|uniref:ABC transporter permease subunit n=1 Tax=Vallitalea pronyensis TaxID=1348613 RepID=A0A8J8MNL4_9FIRM|nr:nickel transporter permease [Vallitalea pronyensis]QUI25232.1 ABC transporter permease subunit [Vallitalea pronyensis]